MLRFLLAPVDAASLAVFRLAFGGIMAWSALHYLTSGRIERYWIQPRFHFTYPGFEWMEPLSLAGMHAVFGAMLACAVLIAIGLLTRPAALAYALLHAWVFLLEQARYLNHAYLISLLAFLLAVVPSGAAWSVDAWRHRREPTVPRWALLLLQAQVGLVYVHAGIAKLDRDWLRAEPMRAWLAARSDHELLGPLLRQDWAPWLFSWGGMLLDFLVVPALLWRRTRLLAFGAAALFHALNATLFSIGVFPPLMLAATTLLLDPGWPRRILGIPRPRRVPAPAPTRRDGALLAFAAGWLAVQVLLPLRHHLYPGYVSWTEEGHTFAWHMKLRDKEGYARFVALDREGGRMWTIDPATELEDWQLRKMAGRPDMILAYAHHLARRLRAEVGRPVEVRADVWVSLNGRPPQRLVDPTVDLAAQPRSLAPKDWILPLEPGR